MDFFIVKMLTNDAAALERGFSLFGGCSYSPGNDIASGLENADEKCPKCGGLLTKAGEYQGKDVYRCHECGVSYHLKNNDIASGLENGEPCPECGSGATRSGGETRGHCVACGKNFNDIASGLQNLTRICSWCGSHMGEKEPLEDKGVTHSMCDSCADAVAKGTWTKARNEYAPAGPATMLELPSRMRNVAPPGMEHVVRALKKTDVNNPYAVAWSIYDKKNARNDEGDPPVATVRG